MKLIQLDIPRFMIFHVSAGNPNFHSIEEELLFIASGEYHCMTRMILDADHLDCLMETTCICALNRRPDNDVVKMTLNDWYHYASSYSCYLSPCDAKGHYDHYFDEHTPDIFTFRMVRYVYVKGDDYIRSLADVNQNIDLLYQFQKRRYDMNLLSSLVVPVYVNSAAALQRVLDEKGEGA